MREQGQKKLTGSRPKFRRERGRVGLTEMGKEEGMDGENVERER